MTETYEIELVEFHGDKIEVTGSGEQGMVSLRRLCANIGVDYTTQLKKLKERSWACVGLRPTHDAIGRTQMTAMVSLPTMHGWLVNLNENRVNPECREKLVQYQREAVQVLARHFNGVVTEAGGPSLPNSPPPVTDPAVGQLLAALTSTVTCVGTLAQVMTTLVDRLGREQSQVVNVPEDRIEEARELAASAVHIQTGSHSSCSVMGYARLTGRHLDEAQAKAHGLKLAAKLRAEGRGNQIGKTSHQRYGGVNTYPVADLADHFGDEPEAVDRVYAAMANS